MIVLRPPEYSPQLREIPNPPERLWVREALHIASLKLKVVIKEEFGAWRRA